MGTRFVVVHYHILKNGGSTIESVLQREFGSGFATLHGPVHSSVLDDADLAEFLRTRPDVTAVSSHHLRYPKPVVRGTVIFDCCFIRHPLDRLQSLYAWARRTDSSDPVCRAARALNAREFARHLLHDFPHMVSNVQVTHLASGGAFLRPANSNDLKIATDILMEMAMPGLVELFDESLVAAEYFLRPAFPGIQLHCQPQNVSRSGEKHRPDRAQKLEDQLIALWGAGAYSDLHRLNQFDLELYDRARNEIERRFCLVPDATGKLHDFEARSAGRATSAAQLMEFAAARY